MKRKDENFYTTGAFAKYFGIKKDTLFYYDEIGLFSPAFVGENGYRYYTASQISPFGTLLALREMNVPLCQIREYFEAPSPAKLEIMATRQMERLEEEIRRRKEIHGIFKQILQDTEEGRTAETGTAMIRRLPPERFIYSSSEPGGEGIQFHQWWDAYGDFVREKEIRGAASVGSLILKEHLERGQFDRVDRLFTPGGRKGRLRPGGEYAVYYVKGPYESLADSYPKLLEEIQKQGYRLDGDVYEEYLISELTGEDPEQFVSRLTVKVCPEKGTGAGNLF
ncbi:MAG TPA: MerR family transcriptional regulator [Candidatus Enterocloster faecavium]|uniref:MerR family transcriptional regulator n=1 Tax=Candidatus Enterocloster faecavium TaxID=2838560 RepID=A0A9D2L5V9_9FIRM|nr:MerR family transcriptional regulator [Candidatus Enterocloster faecavium]